MSNPAQTEEIKAAYDDVRNDKTDTNWLLLSYAEAKGDKLVVKGTGTGGLSEMSKSLDRDDAAYGYAKVTYANDTESKREKFVFVVWIGQGTKVMRKAKVGILAAQVRQVLQHFSIQVDAEREADLDEKVIVPRLRKAGGADYNNQTRA
ncbi:hypothetical protein PYCC9005_004082 [Savitreella phatthalungensis]